MEKRTIIDGDYFYTIEFPDGLKEELTIRDLQMLHCCSIDLKTLSGRLFKLFNKHSTYYDTVYKCVSEPYSKCGRVVGDFSLGDFNLLNELWIIPDREI